jgi:glycosyltransferase involved in cell wall biosynthesis
MTENDLHRRIADLETELARTRRRLQTKEREVEDIHRSLAWGVVVRMRALKQRLVDPILDVLGIQWPRRNAVSGDDRQPAIAPAHPDRHDVVCFAICGWDDRFQRPQQLMSRFARAGHRVFYVVDRARRDGPVWAATVKAENVYEVTLRGDPLQAFDALRNDAQLSDATAMIVQSPSWWPLARDARQRFGWPVVYDCMDLHAGFAAVRRSTVAIESELLADADVVVVSSAMLERQALQKRRDVVMVRNGCDYEHFAATAPSRNARPVIGYYGAIAEWFDAAIVAELAARRPDWDFILVGATYGGAIARLAKLPNVSLPGEQAYESLPEWLGRFDVAIIPFRRIPLTEATNPVKVYELLAAGKAVVSVPIPEVAALAPLVRLASTAEEFEREIEAALIDDPGAAEARRAFARENTWERRFDLLASVTASAIAQRTPENVMLRSAPLA